jgi:hypothetical protein
MRQTYAALLVLLPTLALADVTGPAQPQQQQAFVA